MTKPVALSRKLSRIGLRLYVTTLILALACAVGAIAGATYFALALVAYLNAVGVL